MGLTGNISLTLSICCDTFKKKKNTCSKDMHAVALFCHQKYIFLIVCMEYFKYSYSGVFFSNKIISILIEICQKTFDMLA